MGNVGSIANMLRKIGAEYAVTTNPADILRAGKVILPGVGAFDRGMRRLHDSGFADSLREFVRKGGPLLGICLGMQLLFERSEEGDERVEGFGWIKGDVRQISIDRKHEGRFRVPHMGWSDVEFRSDCELFKGFDHGARFYFVHKYCVNPDDVAAIAGCCQHGGSIVAAVHHHNVFGTQFHPEKSHKFGMKLLSNFAEL